MTGALTRYVIGYDGESLPVIDTAAPVAPVEARYVVGYDGEAMPAPVAPVAPPMPLSCDACPATADRRTAAGWAISDYLGAALCPKCQDQPAPVATNPVRCPLIRPPCDDRRPAKGETCAGCGKTTTGGEVGVLRPVRRPWCGASRCRERIDEAPALVPLTDDRLADALVACDMAGDVRDLMAALGGVTVGPDMAEELAKAYAGGLDKWVHFGPVERGERIEDMRRAIASMPAATDKTVSVERLESLLAEHDRPTRPGERACLASDVVAGLRIITGSAK